MGSERVLEILCHLARILKPNFTSTHVTISRRASSNVHKQFALSIQCFYSSSGTHASRPASLISSSNLSFNFSHSATRGIPIVRSPREVPEESTVQEKISVRSRFVSFLRFQIMSFLQSSPCLPQRVHPRVGDSVICLITREGHECCAHLLQHELQVLYSSLLIRRSRHEFHIDELLRDFRRLFSRSLQHHLGLLGHASKERLHLV